MNTTHYKEPTEQNEKQKDGLLLDAISLRDYFAAKAMQACIPHRRNQFKTDNEDLDDWEEYFCFISDEAYEIADAMLEAREK